MYIRFNRSLQPHYPHWEVFPLTDYDALLNTAASIGVQMLESGAEAYRVEDSLQRLCQAYGVEISEIFAIPSLLIVSFCDPEGHSHTRVRRLYHRGTDLWKVDRLNSLCRRVCQTRPPFPEVDDELLSITRQEGYPPLLQMAGFALTASFFALLFGGTLRDALCSLAAGVSIFLVKGPMERRRTNSFFVNAVSSMTAALVAIAQVILGLGQNLDLIIIGAFMGLVPGVALTNFMRDVLAGDLFAGITKLTESLLTATALALGAGIALSLVRYFGGVV